MTNSQKFGIIVVLFTVIYFLISIGRYFLADVHYAAGQNATRYFSSTQDAQYLLSAYNQLTTAFSLNHSEPAIASEYAVSAAYLSAALAAKDSSAAATLAQLSTTVSQRALAISPRHPNYYKSRARAMILLSDIDPQYLTLAAETLVKAARISPTDPRLPYNLGIIYKYLNDVPTSTSYFQESLKLKPDFPDAKKALEEINTKE